MKTNPIGYCHETINPIVGCSKISPACDNCYAEKMAWRLAHIGTTAERYSGVVDENGWTGKLNFVPSEL
jgi:protein gp37